MPSYWIELNGAYLCQELPFALENNLMLEDQTGYPIDLHYLSPALLVPFLLYTQYY